MPWAYRDKYGILHATDNKQTADEFAKSAKVKQYSGNCIGGYPALTLEVFDYGDGRVFLSGNEKNGIEISNLPFAIRLEVENLLRKIGL